MRWRTGTLAALGVIGALALVAVAGGYNVAASSGHLPGITTLFAWTMHNSVAWRASDARPPAPAAPPTSGAGHYELVCRDCHGAPGIPVPASMRNMLPPPPHALDAVTDWQPGELFWIVKHGIKMTAMPAWPSRHRDDEVWQVVSFMRLLPELDAAAYARAVSAPLPEQEGSKLDATLRRCARCHGADGTGGDAAVPVIAGLDPVYLRHALAAYRAGTRASGFMQAQVSDLTAEQLAAAADHYARQPAPRTTASASASTAAGRDIARDGVAARRVPACAPCHGPAAAPRAPEYPALAGQREGYLRTQLRLFRQGVRGGSDFAPLMHFAARHLTDADIDALAAYYASLPPEDRS